MSDQNQANDEDLGKRDQPNENSDDKFSESSDNSDHISKRLKRDAEYHGNDGETPGFFNREPNPEDFIIEDDGKNHPLKSLSFLIFLIFGRAAEL